MAATLRDVASLWRRLDEHRAEAVFWGVVPVGAAVDVDTVLDLMSIMRTGLERMRELITGAVLDAAEAIFKAMNRGG